MLKKLTTPEGENLRGTPWTVYPRPQMKRDSYLNLNGEWDFAVSEREPASYAQTILVPFCPESELSTVGVHFPEGMPLWYHRRVVLPEGFHRGRVLLHIGAADQSTEVYVNGTCVGSHEGGYDAFSFDITDSLQDENAIVICCKDDLRNQSYPYGKQVLPEKRGGMWYTPVSGIWQTVWLESVPERHIQRMKIENRGYGVTISVEPEMEGQVTVSGLGEFSLEQGKVTITPEQPHLWSPEDPYLYDFVLEAGEDRVESYFAIRSLEIRKVGKYQRLCLNGKPYFFHGLLDQGYWPDGIFTTAGPECYEKDIVSMKKLGFNTLRKHIKVEPEEFYYQCDKLGMIVWQDMVNNGDYGFIRDTALPTAGFQKRPDERMHRDQLGRSRFLLGMVKTVMQLGNHPSICYWTIFNEGWGQFDSNHVYTHFKTIDDTRFVDSTSGWFRRKLSDVDSRHVYFRKVKLEGDGERPIVLSEFGGKICRVDGHIFNLEKSYGYDTCENLEELNDAVVKLYMDEVLPSVRKGLCAAIYTQVSDVEDEINGLVTYDRKVEKMQPEKMLPVAEALHRAVYEN